MTFHGGDIYTFAEQLGCNSNDIIDFSSNIHFEQAVDWRDLSLNLQPYADPNYTDLKHEIKQRYALAENVDLAVFNGASAAIFALLRLLKFDDLVLYAPIFSEYERVAESLDCNIHYIDRFEGNLFAPVPENSTIIFVNPSTPDGKLYDLAALFAHWKAANCTIIVDESFLDFCDAPSMMPFIDYGYPRIFIVKSLCKFYGCAGVRVGFIAGVNEFIDAFSYHESSWRVSTFDNIYMQTALKNIAFIEQTRVKTKRLRAKLEQVLINSNLFEKIYEGSANFVLTRLKTSEFDLQNVLADSKILIRVCESFEGLTTQDIRFAVKSEADIEKLATALIDFTHHDSKSVDVALAFRFHVVSNVTAFSGAVVKNQWT
jgi:threonine-phosphate decarboxylase